MAWIFQGNPKKFDIDDYLARYPELIYWRVPRYQAEVSVGDRAYIFRAGSQSGVVASGRVVEAPTNATKVLHPEALGDDLWFADKPDDDEHKVGIALDSVRLSSAEGMLPRAVVKHDLLLGQGTIITMSNGTVFRLNDRAFLSRRSSMTFAVFTAPSTARCAKCQNLVAIPKRSPRASLRCATCHRWLARPPLAEPLLPTLPLSVQAAIAQSTLRRWWRRTCALSRTR